MPAHQRIKIQHAAHCLRAGGVIAYPTETVWGLGCDPLNPQAVQRLLTIKQRAMARGLILIAADLAHLQDYIKMPNKTRMKKVLASWPGPTTWVFPAQAWVPEFLRGRHSGIAVRISSHPLAQALCKYWGGALISTSANISGRPVVRNGFLLRRYLAKRLDYILSGQPGPHAGASQIRDVLSGKLMRA